LFDAFAEKEEVDEPEEGNEGEEEAD